MPVIFVKAASDDPIAAIAAKLEGKLRIAFLRAVQALKDQLGTDALIEALKTGDVDQSLAILAVSPKFVNALNGVGIEPGIQSFRDAVAEVFAAGAAGAATILPRFAGLGTSFSLMNPESLKFLDDYSMPLIQQVSDNTRDAVRDVVADAFRNGGHPAEQARQIRGFIGLTANQVRAVSNYRASLSSADNLHQSLRRALRDGRFDPTVNRAMRNNIGLSASQIDRMTARYQDRYLQHRAYTIARTESVRASNKGQSALWNIAVSKGLLNPAKVKRQWIASGDDATCEDCMALNGEVAGLDEEFDDGIMQPPDPHPDCRCAVALVFA